MLFVPSIGDVSPHFTANTADADIVSGAQVLSTPAGACWRNEERAGRGVEARR